MLYYNNKEVVNRECYNITLFGAFGAKAMEFCVPELKVKFVFLELFLKFSGHVAGMCFCNAIAFCADHELRAAVGGDLHRRIYRRSSFRCGE